MKASPPLKITSSGRTRGNSSSETPPDAEHVSFNPGQVGCRYGWVEIISPERRYTRGWSCLYVQTRCTGCGAVRWHAYANLTSGKSQGCQACSQPQQVPKWLIKRVTAMRSRCTNPKDAGFKRYGGRGIAFGFESVLAGAIWIQENLGLKRELELDRIDNNGPYAPGNLRYASKSDQMRNQRRSKLQIEDDEWARTQSPLGYHASCKYLRHGYPKEAVIGLAYKAVLDKRKNWKGIKARLEQLGYLT